MVSVALMRSICLRFFTLFEFVLVLFKLSSLLQFVSFVMFEFYGKSNMSFNLCSCMLGLCFRVSFFWAALGLDFWSVLVCS